MKGAKGATAACGKQRAGAQFCRLLPWHKSGDGPLSSEERPPGLCQVLGDEKAAVYLHRSDSGNMLFHFT